MTLSSLSEARAITEAMGGQWRGRYGLMKCPCHPDKNPSLQISDDPNKSCGIAVHCHAGCDWADIKDELRRRGWARDDGKPYPHRIQESDSASRIEYALSLWKQSVSLADTLAGDISLSSVRFMSVSSTISIMRCAGIQASTPWSR